MADVDYCLQKKPFNLDSKYFAIVLAVTFLVKELSCIPIY